MLRRAHLRVIRKRVRYLSHYALPSSRPLLSDTAWFRLPAATPLFSARKRPGAFRLSGEYLLLRVTWPAVRMIYIRRRLESLRQLLKAAAAARDTLQLIFPGNYMPFILAESCQPPFFIRQTSIFSATILFAAASEKLSFSFISLPRYRWFATGLENVT